MSNDLKMLLELQVIDYDIGELERSKEYLPDMMDNLKREIEETRTRLDSIQTELESSKLRQKALELENQTKETDLQRFQQQMMSIKTNKEYDALVAQIDAVKETMSVNDTELLELMDKIEVLEKEQTEQNEKMSQIDENNTRQFAILQEKVDSIGDKMTDKLNGRKELASGLTRSTLSVYERVRRGKGGSVVVVVKRRACGACYKALTPKKVQEIKKADRINTCDNCGRIFFWNEAESN